MILIVVEAVPASSKPPAVDDSRHNSTDGICDFGALASSVTRASPMHFSGAERISASLPKLVKLSVFLQPGQKRCLRFFLHLLQRPPYAREPLCLRLRLPPWRDGAAESDAAAVLLDAGYSCSYPYLRNIDSSGWPFCRNIRLSSSSANIRHISSIVSSPDP